MARIPYALLCTLLGVMLGLLPRLVHGPIPEKYDVLYIKGAIAVWGWYLARSAIGFLVGITSWPERWWLRGPLCGLVMLVPLSFVSLATPGCGAPCAASNVGTAVAVGTAVGGLAFLLTGRHRA
jgi:hypothetical protein